MTLLAGLLFSSGSVLGLSRTGEEDITSHSTTELLLWLGGSSMIPLVMVIFSRLECLCLCPLTEARDGW